MRTFGPLAATLLAALLALPACITESDAPEKPDAPDTASTEPAKPPAPLPIVESNVPGLPSAHQVGKVIVTGQPTPEGLVNARDAGATMVINMRPQSEMTYDEASVAQGLGMRYVNLGFTPATLDDQLVDAFILQVKSRKPEDGQIVLHCASGNRAAALWAMYEIKELKVDPQMAVERARKLGLTSAELVAYIGDYSRRVGAF